MSCAKQHVRMLHTPSTDQQGPWSSPPLPPAEPLTLICRMSPSWAGHPRMMSPVLVSSSTMKPEEKPAITLRPLGLTAKQRMSPALTPLARRNSCCKRERPVTKGLKVQGI